ncbi:MAG: glycosyltransferase family 39 protein [Anaerolineae bacterium]|nr:glycosyltransferase family 39 protein [Anaerolineae bacterium]
MRLLRHLLPAAAILLLANGLRLHQIDSQSLWFDEGWSAWAAIQPTLAEAALADDTNPPLYYVLLNISTRFLGDSEFSLRLPSLWLVLIAIALTWQLARRNFGRQSAWLALWLAACSAPLWWAAQEARMYALLALLLPVLLLAWQELLRRPQRRQWLLLVILETLILYTHNTAPVFVLWINLAMALHWLSRRSLRQPDWRLWLVSQVAVVLLWLPWLSAYFIDVAAANSTLRDGPQAGLTLVGQMWAALWLAPWELVLQTPLTGVVVPVAFALLLLLPWRRSGTRWLALHVMLMAFLLALGLGIIGNNMHGRYLVPLAPLHCILLGSCVVGKSGGGRRHLLVMLFSGALLLNLQLAADPALRHDDARGMVRYYQESLSWADSVLAWSYAERYELAYYWRRFGLPTQLITLPEGEGLNAIAGLLPRQGRVALNQWYTQRADYRGMTPCLLAHGSTRLPEVYSVYGMSNLLFDAPPSLTPQLQPLAQAITVDGANRAIVTTHGTLPEFLASQVLCLPVLLEAGPELRTELQASIVIRNRLGQVVSKDSAIFATDDQRSGLQVRPGDVLSAWPTLRLPFGAPPDNYEIWLRVFDEVQALDGHELRRADGAPVGRDLKLGTWGISPGADWELTGRETGLPVRNLVQVGDDLQLLADNLAGGNLQPGQTLTTSLLWRGGDALPDLTLAAVDGSWARVLPPTAGPRDRVTLDWREVTVPATAGAGDVHLLLPDGRALARWSLDVLPRLDVRPEYTVAVGENLGTLGRLAGYTLAEVSPGLDGPLEVTLVWQARSVGTETGYTVFVHLVNDRGQIIAQSDSVPAQGRRPTSGWRREEFILDRHDLRFNALARAGPARLLVGMYDARSGQRLAQWSAGADHVALPGDILLR